LHLRQSARPNARISSGSTSAGSTAAGPLCLLCDRAIPVPRKLTRDLVRGNDNVLLIFGAFERGNFPFANTSMTGQSPAVCRPGPNHLSDQPFFRGHGWHRRFWKRGRIYAITSRLLTWQENRGALAERRPFGAGNPSGDGIAVSVRSPGLIRSTSPTSSR